MGIGNLFRAIGSLGNDVALAKFANEQDQLNRLMAGLQLQELRQRITQGNQLRSAGLLGLQGGGTAGVTFDPSKGTYGMQTLVPRAAGTAEALDKHLDSLIADKDTTSEEAKVYKLMKFDLAQKGDPMAVAQELLKYQMQQKPETQKSWMEPKPYVVPGTGQPVGISRPDENGKMKIFYPGKAGWTQEDQDLLDTAKSGVTAAFKSKEQLQKERIDAYASMYSKMRGQVQEYGVIDLQTGLPAMVNANTINANPGRYGPGALTQQVKNRVAIFSDLDYAKNQINQALDGLSDQDFKAIPRAQIALALSSTDPGSAMQQFMASEYAASLSPAQMMYVTALLNGTESAMALRSVAGLGQGSDLMRNAIMGMLPGPKTPSLEFAHRQMQLFQGTIANLRKSLPPGAALGIPDNSPASNTPSGATAGGGINDRLGTAMGPG